MAHARPDAEVVGPPDRQDPGAPEPSTGQWPRTVERMGDPVRLSAARPISVVSAACLIDLEPATGGLEQLHRNERLEEGLGSTNYASIPT